MSNVSFIPSVVLVHWHRTVVQFQKRKEISPDCGPSINSEVNMWLPLTIVFSTVVFISIVVCAKKKRTSIMEPVHDSKLKHESEAHDTAEKIRSLEGSNMSRSADARHPVVAAPPPPPPPPAPRPAPLPPPPPPQPAPVPLPPQPVQLPLVEGAGDDVGYESCPDMTPEELARVLQKSAN
ncbi:hypothetical protein RB195_011400 [Necator americanus]|uniref:Uncharacterized protein n=1 Tax=Necator americanus TaxID=51031 RepID=A0ABR1D409_NECAM